jgi:LysR family transcriptional regulator, cell division regulator
VVPTSTEIEYFVEIFETRHLSNAAIRLGVSQPTLTHSLQSLEEKVGAKLFHRTRQGVVPTEQGAVFYRKSHTLLECWAEAKEGVIQSATEVFGRFKIGCHPSVGGYALPKFLGNLNADAPGIEIELVHDSSRKITEGIVNFKIDLGFVVNPFRHPDLVLKRLGDDRVMFWKARRADVLPKRIFADKGIPQIEGLKEKTYAKEFKGWAVVGTSSLELIRTLTLSGQGVGVLPERVAKADGAGLVPYSSDLPVFKDKIFVAYRKEVMSSNAGKALVRLAAIDL